MADVAKFQSNSPQLAIRGNYRTAAARDMAKVYSRNLAQQQLRVSDFAQIDFENNTSLESVKIGHDVFPGDTHQNDAGSFDIEFHGREPRDWALKLLAIREKSDVWQKGKRIYDCLPMKKLLSAKDKTARRGKGPPAKRGISRIYFF